MPTGSLVAKNKPSAVLRNEDSEHPDFPYVNRSFSEAVVFHRRGTAGSEKDHVRSPPSKNGSEVVLATADFRTLTVTSLVPYLTGFPHVVSNHAVDKVCFTITGFPHIVSNHEHVSLSVSRACFSTWFTIRFTHMFRFVLSRAVFVCHSFMFPYP